MKRLSYLQAIVFVLHFLPLRSQTISGNLENYLEDIIEDAPGDSGNDYQLPSSDEFTIWTNLIGLILGEEIEEASILADQVDYQIKDYAHTANDIIQHYYILQERMSSNKYWGTYVFRQYDNREYLVLQAPHAKSDSNTGLQSVFCFINTNAKDLFLNGTHRCNHNELSFCSGTTSVCGSNNSYPISDMAHNANSIFQMTTDILYENIANSIFIQLHGFAKKESDPYVILSNGTREKPNVDYILLLRSALINQDNSLTFQIAHINTSWTRLIGFTNTQGRLINNSEDACLESAIETSGRFIHIEQESSKLREEEGWSKISNAILDVFPATLNTMDQEDDLIVTIYPNPSFGHFEIKGENIKSLSIFSTLGELVFSKRCIGDAVILNVNCQPLNPGTYFIRVVGNGKSFLKKLMIQRK